MEKLVITISREFGSGGAAIGEKVAEALDIEYYDRSTIDTIAREKGIAGHYIKNWNEQSAASIAYNYNWSSDDPFYYNENSLFRIQSNIICELADKSACVVVGRCADYVLRGRADCLNVMIYANKSSKLSRLYDEYYVRNGDLAKLLVDMDKARSSYYKWFTGDTWGSPYNYHLLLESDVYGIQGCADIIVTAAKYKQKIQNERGGK